MTPKRATEFCLRSFEYGVNDDPDDPGGLTVHGITLKFLRRARPGATREDLWALSFEDCCDVAFTVLMFQGRIAEIVDWRLRLVTFDFALNAGEDDSIPALQRVLNQQPVAGLPMLHVDGKLGPKTIGHANRLLPFEARVAACAHLAKRQQFHIERSYASRQEKWLRGWLRRCTTLLTTVTNQEREEP